MEKKKFYMTTAIAYTSGKPHIGNVYEAILADCIARFKRLQGNDVFFLTGTDEHGEKIQNEAEKRGITPQQFVDGVADVIKGTWNTFHISYDKFIRTTDEGHVKTVQKIFTKFYEQGDIYKGNYEGPYCVPCESFWTNSQLKDGCCPDCGRPVGTKQEEAYYFRMSKYAQKLAEHIESHDDFIVPASRKHEMLNNFIKPGLQDLCISRSTFSWGIPIPGDEKHIAYVWFDALNNYITAIGYDPENPTEQFNKLWPADLHIIGKDIVRFHTIYWPIFLMALGLPLPKTVMGHPWLLAGDDKMSKSKGNVIYGDELVEKFGLDAVRYYLLSEMGFYNDGCITYELMVKRTNADLANTLGNLVSRTCAMVKQYFGGVIPAPAGEDSPFAVSLKQNVTEKLENAYRLMDRYSVAEAVEEIFVALRACNKYIDETTPWVLAKDESKKGELACVMANLMESIRLCNIMLTPFMPDACEKIDAIITAKPAEICNGQFGYTYELTGHELGETPILFTRIDEKKFMDALLKEQAAKAKAAKEAEKAKKAAEAKKEEAPVGLIGIEDFAKVELTVGQVVSCEPVEKSDKLLKLMVDIGTEKRQVVSGIAKWYKPEDLLGKKLVLVTNLKPVKLRGVESFGMILAADKGEEACVLFLDDSIPVGSKIH